MQCPCPINIQDPRAKTASTRLVVPCTKCPVCLQNRRLEWSARLNEETRTAKTAWFLTLTYNDQEIPYNEHGIQTLKKKDLQLFHKRVWQKIDRWKKEKNINYPKFRYYATGEYGEKTERPHYHAIYWNIPKHIVQDLDKIWGHGQIQIGTCTPASVNYVTKYMINRDTTEDYRETPKAMMSLKPALGAEYIKRNDAWHVINQAPYMIQDGKKVRMPRYYKDKIFTESEKEKIAKIVRDRQDEQIKNAWEEAYKKGKDYDKERIDKIEDTFRKIEQNNKSNEHF